MITPEQVTTVAPDARLVKAGKEWAVVDQLAALYPAEKMLWGQAQGLGGEQYFTQVTVDDSAFQCGGQCQKLPCEHALGLSFLVAHNATLFAATVPCGRLQQC